MRPFFRPVFRRAVAGIGIGVALLVIGAHAATAQELLPKRVVPGGEVVGCAEQAAPSTRPTAAAVQRARALVRAGQEAALIGDHATALARLGEAAQLDPTDPEIAYLIARVHEETGSGADAVRQFCRYLALAPDGADAGEVRQRIATLAAPSAGTVPPHLAEQFYTALSFFDAGQLHESETALTYVLRERPGLAEAHYNRALARVALNRTGPAIQDLERYLDLSPAADDRDEVLATIAALRAAAISPASALRNGLLLPGLGQVVTRRPALGVAVFGAVGASTFYALQTREETRTVTFVDRFGNPYEEQVTTTTRPNLSTGLAVAAAVSLLAAGEAYQHAAHRRRTTRRPTAAAVDLVTSTLRIEPARDGAVRFGLRIPLDLR